MRNFLKIQFIILIVFIVCLASCSRDERSQYQVLMEAGRASFESGHYDDAIQAWDNALKLDPDNTDILIPLATAHQRLAQFDLSTQLFQRAADKMPNSVEAFFMIAQNHILVGDFESAQNTCSRIETMMTPDYRLIVLKGDIASFKGSYHEGELLYQQAIGLDSQRSDAYFKLAASLLVQEQEKRADNYYRQAVDIGEQSTAQYWLHRAEYLALKGDADNAEAAMKQALALQPDDFFIKLKIAQLLLSYKKYDELLKFFGQPVDFSAENPAIQKIIVETLLNTNQLERAHTLIQHHRLSNDSEWMLLLGKYSLLDGSYTNAISHFERALEKRKDDPNAYYMLALAYIAADKTSLASQTLIRLLTIFPGMIDAELALAGVYYKKKDYDLSVDYLEKVIDQTPESFRAYLMLGNCMLATGQYVEAELNFQRALTLDARSIPARYYLALTLERTDRSAQAIGLYQSILEDTPEMADAGLRLANLLVEQGRAGEARDMFSALVETHPENGYLKFILARIYGSSQSPDKAAYYYRLAINDNPELVEGYKKLAEMQTDDQEKLAILGEGIEKVPESDELKIALADLYFKADDLDSAIDLMNKVHLTAPHSPAVENNLAWLYLEKGTDLVKAYQLAVRAYDSDPDNPHYAHTLGWAYHKKGIGKQAEWYLREAVRLLDEHPEIDPGNQYAKGIFSYHLALALMETDQDEEAREKLLFAVSAGLPAKYEKHARDILEK